MPEILALGQQHRHERSSPQRNEDPLAKNADEVKEETLRATRRGRRGVTEDRRDGDQDGQQ